MSLWERILLPDGACVCIYVRKKKRTLLPGKRVCGMTDIPTIKLTPIKITSTARRKLLNTRGELIVAEVLEYFKRESTAKYFYSVEMFDYTSTATIRDFISSLPYYRELIDITHKSNTDYAQSNAQYYATVIIMLFWKSIPYISRFDENKRDFPWYTLIWPLMENRRYASRYSRLLLLLSLPERRKEFIFAWINSACVPIVERDAFSRFNNRGSRYVGCNNVARLRVVRLRATCMLINVGMNRARSAFANERSEGERFAQE